MTMAPERPPLEIEGDLFQDESFVGLEAVKQEVHERHFGNIEFKSLELNSLILFSQIRDKKNQRFDELEESIDNDDLDNPINIACMTRQELEDYIAFTNKTWKASTKISDFDAYVQPNGRYNVVVAGHSRTLSMKNIARKHTESTGQATNYTVLCKIEKDNSVEAVVSKQFLENIHAAVPPHREAEAVVEMYNQGLGSKWHTPAEFRAACKNVVSALVLDKALAYGELFEPARNMVVSGTMPYAVAVQLGKLAQVLRVHCALERGLDPAEPLPIELEKTLTYDVMGDCARRFRENYNQKAAIGEIEKQLNEKLAEIRDLSGLEKNASLQDILQSITHASTTEKVRAKKKRTEDTSFDLEGLLFTPEEQEKMAQDDARRRFIREARAVLPGQLEKSAKFVRTLIDAEKEDPRVATVVHEAVEALEDFTTQWNSTEALAGGLAVGAEGVTAPHLRLVRTETEPEPTLL
jgi:hypothetical protein